MKFNNILIVDDSATSRMIIKRCFEIAGYRDSKYYEAENGLQAISLLEEKTIDLILSDLKMPKMDGKTFIKKIKCNNKTKEVTIIVISSMSNDITEEQLIQQGVKGIIQKPISPQKILNTLGVI